MTSSNVVVTIPNQLVDQNNVPLVLTATTPVRHTGDFDWCDKNKPKNGFLDAYELFQEAQVLSSYEHLAAVFGTTVEVLAGYETIIKRGQRIGEHAFFKKLKARMELGDREAIKIYAEFLKLYEMDKSAPVLEDDMDSDKARDILRRK